MIGSDLQITRNDFTHELKNNRSLNFNSGEKFGERYRIISELGKGGMGQVFKAHDNVLDIDVALKMIRPEFLMNKKMISRFKQEILLAREITHENVSRIHDFGDVDGIKFISMEFISGRTLKDIVRKDGPIDIERAIEISKAICSGLSAAHKKEIIHRDLKPQNIMIDDDGHVFITDFGLAKSVREENVSHTGLVIGTPQYIPPELWKGEVADKRSDIYSLGIIMYEMVAGEELFQSDSDYGYLQKHVTEEPVFPADKKDKLPGFFRQLILRCLAKEREARYKDCGEIYRDMKDRLYSTGTFINNFERSVKKTGPFKIGLAVLFIIILSLAGSLILKKGPPKQKKRSVAILYFKNLSGLKSLDHFSYSLPELLTTDLGQSKYIKVLPEDKVSKVLKESNYLSSAFIDEKMFEELGDQANVNYLVQGSFIKSGNDLRITVKLRDSDTGEMLSTDYQDATMDNIFPAVDRLTTGLKKRFNLTENEIFADIDSEIASITTSSQEALNYYITGKRLFNDNKFDECLVEYGKAVNIDPEFAMAYRDMAWAYAYLNDWVKRKEYFEKTIQYIEKLSEREKYLIYGDYYGEEEITFQKSFDSYKKILEIYPNDFESNYQAGVTYRVIGEYEKGIEHLSVALNEDKTNHQALEELLNCYQALGKYNTAEKKIGEFIRDNNVSNNDIILGYLYDLKLENNEFEAAAQIVDKRNEIARINQTGMKYNKGIIQILEGNYSEAEETISTIGDSKSAYPSITNLKYFYLFSGEFSKFIDRLKLEIRESEYVGWANQYRSQLLYFYIGIGLHDKAAVVLKEFDRYGDSKTPTRIAIMIELEIQNEIAQGNLENSRILLKELEEINKKVFTKRQSSRRYAHIMGKFHDKNKQYKLAEKYYLKSLEGLENRLNSQYASPFFYNTALFYYRQNKHEKAEPLFQHIHKLSNGRLYRGDQYVKSFYYLGKIYQKRKWTGKAIESYKKFIHMWANGEPKYVRSFINDARNGLSELSGGKN